MTASDTTSHASLNGLYVKAQELDRGHAAPPALKLAPPGATLDSRTNPQASASSHASDGAQTQGSASSKANAKPHRSSSRDFQMTFGEDSCTIEFFCFDTPNYVTVYGSQAAAPKTEQVLLAIRKACLELHELWSYSDTSSDVAQMNKRAEQVEIDIRTARLLEEMIAFNASEPLFDFTVGPVSYLWKHAREVPSQERIDAALSHVGAHLVTLDGTVVHKSDPKVKIDVGGAGKGAAADMAAAMLKDACIECAEVNLGGNLYVLGTRTQDRPWNIDIRVPDGVSCRPITLNASDESVVTSGSYERYVVIDGKRYQHIIDPRTGWPSKSDIVSATVVGKSSLIADMLATTACLTGSEGLDALAARHSGYRFIAILDNGSILRY